MMSHDDECNIGWWETSMNRQEVCDPAESHFLPSAMEWRRALQGLCGGIRGSAGLDNLGLEIIEERLAGMNASSHGLKNKRLHLGQTYVHDLVFGRLTFSGF
jgi:hypothetical protein